MPGLDSAPPRPERGVVAGHGSPASSSAPGTGSSAHAISAPAGDASAATAPASAGPPTPPRSPSSDWTPYAGGSASGATTCGHTTRAEAISGGTVSPPSVADATSSHAGAPSDEAAAASPSSAVPLATANGTSARRGP